MDSTQLVQIRKDYYNLTRKRVEHLVGAETKELKLYRERYEKELNRLDWVSIDQKHLFARLEKAQLVVVGDFHAQKQSSRGLLRIIRKMKKPLILGLECLRAQDQKIIDLFLKGQLSERDFLNQISWKKNWGFPWENYRPLFKWAQQHKVRVFGLNSSSRQKTLRERDEFSADVVSRIKQAYPEHQLFIQYGDLHLASMHLPKSIQKKNPKINLCVVYQSPEILYFKIMESHQELTTDVVKLSEDRWAINGLPPWVKWQDYLLLLESGYDRKVSLSDLDPTDTVLRSVELISKSFNMITKFDALSVYSSSDDIFFEKIETLGDVLRRRILESVQEGNSFYIPELQIGYLARLSVNHVTKLAAQYIYFQEKGFQKTIVDPKKDFLKLIWLEAVTYFCSKVKNPKRKTDTLQDIRNSLQKEQFDDRGKEALSLALTQKLTEHQFLSENNIKSMSAESFSKINRKSFAVAAQILGGILGEKLFYAFNKKLLRLPLNKNLIFKDLQAPHFNKSYYESLEMLESWPLAFASKFDKL